MAESRWRRLARLLEVELPPSILFRSVFRGRVISVTPGWLLEQTADHVVIGLVAGTQTARIADPRSVHLQRLAAGTERMEQAPWHTSHGVWLMPLDAAYAIGHFWNATSGAFLGHYINLQAPLRRRRFGFDSMDHVLDVVIDPDGAWRWKDEDEFAEAVQLGLLTPDEAGRVRRQGEAVIARLGELLPTGWESWRPDPNWPTLRLPPDWRQTES